MFAMLRMLTEILQNTRDLVEMLQSGGLSPPSDLVTTVASDGPGAAIDQIDTVLSETLEAYGTEGSSVSGAIPPELECVFVEPSEETLAPSAVVDAAITDVVNNPESLSSDLEGRGPDGVDPIPDYDKVADDLKSQTALLDSILLQQARVVYNGLPPFVRSQTSVEKLYAELKAKQEAAEVLL